MFFATGNKIFYAMLGVEKALLPTPHSLEGNLTIATRTADGPGRAGAAGRRCVNRVSP